MPDPPDDPTDDGPDYRQLSVVALAALAIVLAAFLAPAGNGIMSPDANVNPDADPNVDPNANPNVDPGSTPAEPQGDGPDSIPDLDINWDGLLEWTEFDWLEDEGPDAEPTDDADREIERGDGGLATPACTIWLDREPTPGSEVAARIQYEGEPVTGADVWYNDDYVGKTDEHGQVTGTVPYVENLNVRIESDEYPACSGTAETASVTASATGLPGAGAGTITTATASASAMPTDSTANAPALASAQEVDEVDNGSVEYEVEGEVEITVRGPPDPGESVTVEASIEGVPMANASVTIDGEVVAETDANGTATVDVPDDGTESFELGVARGDFAGTTTVEVRLLEVSLSPEGLVPIPGSPGVLEATVDDEPVADAEVRIGGEAIGTTDDDGRLAVALPVDPTTAITVSTPDRTETVSLAGQYGGIAAVLGVAVVGLTAVAARTHGRRGAAAVLGATAAALVVLTVEAFYGRTAGTLALLALAALALAVTYVRSDRTIVDERPSPGDAAEDALEWLVDRLLALVALLERVVDWVRTRLAAARTWASSLPRSGRALAAAFGGWLAALPARAVTIGRRWLEALRGVPSAVIVGSLAAVPAVSAGYIVDGTRGATVVAAALGVAALLYRGRDEDDDHEVREDEGDEDERVERTDTVPDTAPETDDRLTFRELWRAFARRVAPRRWRHYTPGEVQRAARQQGYPARPVDELTTLFREVEYGRRPLSRGVRDRADTAYAALLETESDGDDNDADDSDGSTADDTTDRDPGGERP
ncbi:hypothetical protein Htur_3548 [Haloterrigena turkmenica DSM 5511]|uniref:Protein-glutamine gamma-glutamyltransferase-like C-terminal domain-containing protein n=1 Tax=Haloterrigena turkmenica (strain ATCC 51198 / DSM 5511 / JCM 9101 / NCIMB 13204 / VKM B-1734 / 4k) TaxID=543526 RepID=D2RR14_HALTV|nr:DUF4129 domain-containing protein [Haloterrigena turkmenica]ADB62410.1 hypothetical protein Htur_3548 [Haloterrigena turkmenica DSM 5511]